MKHFHIEKILPCYIYSINMGPHSILKDLKNHRRALFTEAVIDDVLMNVNICRFPKRNRLKE